MNSESVRGKHTAAGRLLVAGWLAVAVWAGASMVDAPPLVALSAGTCAAVAALARVRGRSADDIVRTWWRYLAGNRPSDTVVRDFPQESGRPVGLRWNGTYVAAVVEVLSAPGRLTRLGRESEESGYVLPLGAVAACLRRHDVTLDAIDVVVHGRRVLDATPAGQVYAQLVGPLPAAAVRTVWIVLGFDGAACPGAVASRGGGSDGAARTVTASARRIVRTLLDAGCPARTLTAAEVEAASLKITHGVDPVALGQNWRFVSLPAGFNTGGSLDPRRIERATLDRVWAHPTLASTLTLRLRPGDSGSVQVGGLVRFTTRTPRGPAMSGIRSAGGCHRESLSAALPRGDRGPETSTGFRPTTAAVLDELKLPAAGCGQLIGSDTAGRAVAVRLTGHGVRSVYVAGELYLAQQIVFRAVAIGARVLIHTDRVNAWRPLLDGAAGPDRLRMAGEFPGDREFDTVVYDGVHPSTVPPHVSAIHVHSHPDRLPQERPTITVLQPGAAGDRVILTAGGQQTTLTLVTIAAETTHIGRPRTVEAVPRR
ncbi:type VII secretion protein EccE [Rhodococcus chondri]|uniref:Type VII secretion protein EccE n=1 Tax=Rhodococcus chondri TaxID=3065941 RepID=A0ABU7JQ44_9NOCA|nr:type VII secretion protein EccE [Rhodococcus sp. CC-R104]MEE2032146.1 type VII secretion protein EccE [Rhodococcus sp. CC-R104]